MDHRQLYTFIKDRILMLFEDKHLFCIAAKKYKYVSETFTADLQAIVSSIPSERSVDQHLQVEVVNIGDKTRGCYLALSALYCRMIANGDSSRSLKKIVSSLEELRVDCSSDSSESDSDSGEPNPMLLALSNIYQKSIKSQIVDSVASLTIPPPDGVHYSEKRVAENKASATKLEEGMKVFEAFVSSSSV
ncbi:Hypothetical protein POVR2_LOCUS4 [uncultured virus]|nr:Hypothetical protein POVR2_LOCUS4 [uncultured virus]